VLRDRLKGLGIIMPDLSLTEPLWD
jgi:hypothetical protein